MPRATGHGSAFPFRGTTREDGVELGAQQQRERGDPHPQQQYDDARQGTIGDAERAEVGDIEGEAQRSGEPDEHPHHGAGCDELELLPGIREHEVEDRPEDHHQQCREGQSQPAHDCRPGRTEPRGERGGGHRDEPGEQRQDGSREHHLERDPVDLPARTALRHTVGGIEGRHEAHHPGGRRPHRGQRAEREQPSARPGGELRELRGGEPAEGRGDLALQGTDECLHLRGGDDEARQGDEEEQEGKEGEDAVEREGGRRLPQLVALPLPSQLARELLPLLVEQAAGHAFHGHLLDER